MTNGLCLPLSWASTLRYLGHLSERHKDVDSIEHRRSLGAYLYLEQGDAASVVATVVDVRRRAYYPLPQLSDDASRPAARRD